MTIDIRPIDLSIVQKILRQKLLSGTKVWVFGSRATQKAKKTSDLDLAIDVGRKLTTDEEIKLIDAFEESDLPFKVDIVDMYCASEWLKEIIEKKKIEINF